MKYTVIWKPAAEADLARLWTDSPDKRAITDASDRIDALLKKNPGALGESRSGNDRILVIAPLALIFEVLEDDKLVRVLNVARWGGLPQN
jgi:plasmid stabilization system protein ParE